MADLDEASVSHALSVRAFYSPVVGFFHRVRLIVFVKNWPWLA
jgi:hypothetical protein